MSRLAQLTLPLVLTSSLAGCATYTDHLNNATRQTSAGNYAGALAETTAALGVASADELPAQWSGDRPLIALERASLQQAVERFPSAARDLSGAEGELELLDLKTDPIGTLGSYLYSDSFKTYRTPPTERLSLNAINMLNYLAKGDLDGAAVEARRFQVMRDYLASQNIKADGPATLGTYVSGFIFERRGEGDRALRYYEEALASGRLESLETPIRRLARDNPYRGPRVSGLLARAPSAPPSKQADGELLIVLNLGRVPHREPKRIPVGAAVGLAGTFISGNTDFLRYGASKVIVYPELMTTPSSVGTASVQMDGQPLRIEELTNLGTAIRKEYDELKPQIIAAALTRMASRAAMAEGVRAAGGQKNDAVGDILSILFESAMVAFDRPDTRSWTMLPDRVLVARVPATKGTHRIDVDLGSGARRTLAVDVVDGGFAAVVITEPR